MHQPVTPLAMSLRRSTVELPSAVLKYRTYGHPLLLPRCIGGAQTEIGLAAMAYNLMCTANILGGLRLTQQFRLARIKHGPKTRTLPKGSALP